MKKTLIFQDTENLENTVHLLEVAERIYGRGQFESHGIVLEDPFNCLTGSFHTIIRVSEGLVDDYDPRGITDILETLYHRNRYDTILIPATWMGKMVAPRLAERLRTGLVTGVTDIKKDRDHIEVIRPAYCGKILERIRYNGTGPFVMSIRLNAFEYRSGGGLKTKICEYTEPVISRSALKRLSVKKNEQAYDIRVSDVIISGGEGIKDNFTKLYSLADMLNGTVAASRKLVDQGIAPRHIQVGQSGKTISPRLYMAIGIHGSMQHIAGLRNVESIISINTSPTAPVCSLSDIVVQGEATEFIDRLMDRISIYRSGVKGE